MLIMMFTRSIVFASCIMCLLIDCSQCKPQISTASISDADFLDQLDCEDILDTASCLDSKENNLCHVIGPTVCKKTCGLCPKQNCEDLLETASCVDSKHKNLCAVIGPTGCKKTCGLCPTSNFDTLVKDRIVDNASPINEMGGTASLHTSSTDLSTSTYRCAAVLLNDRYLISAAHCLNRTGKERLTTISLGRANLTHNPLPHQIYQINKQYIHPAYAPAVHDYNDIGIIMTERRIHFIESIWPLCLPPSNLVLIDFMYVQIAGWGRVNQTHTSQTLQTNFIKIVKNSRCVTEWKALDSDYYEGIIRQNYPQGLNERLLCGQRDGVSSCEGDSGGPMTFENVNGRTLIGLISKGVPCPRTPVAPIFYTNIANYVDWILETIKGAQPLGSVNCGGPVSSSTGTPSGLPIGGHLSSVGSGEPLSAIVTKHGQCPPISSSCLETGGFDRPRQCSDDGGCAGYDKCCFNACVQHHTCKPPIGIFNSEDFINTENPFAEDFINTENPFAVSGSSSCHRWCHTPQGQAYCCESDNEQSIFDSFTKRGQCPPISPSCPETGGFVPPRQCSDDGGCAGFDICCFNACVQHHTCKPPIGIFNSEDFANTENPFAVSGSSSCRRWCRTPQGQAYCCDSGNEASIFDAFSRSELSPLVTKQGQCPPVRPSCPPNIFPSGQCISDGVCEGFDKCCFDTCLQHHTCKPPIGFGK